MNRQTTKFYGTSCTTPKASWRSSEMVFRNLPIIQIAISPAYPSVQWPFLSPLTSLSTTRLHSRGNWMPPPSPTGQAALMCFSCKYDYNFPATQDDTNPPTYCVSNPIPFRSFYYNLKRGTVKGLLNIWNNACATASAMCVTILYSAISVNLPG